MTKQEVHNKSVLAMEKHTNPLFCHGCPSVSESKVGESSVWSELVKLFPFSALLIVNMTFPFSVLFIINTPVQKKKEVSWCASIHG